MKIILQSTFAFVLLITGFSTYALDVKLTPLYDYVDVSHNGTNVRVQRIQDQSHVITGGFAKTSRKCPPFCAQPMQVAANVNTVGEVEIFKFMERRLNSGKGVIVDARLSSWFKKGTIPGSINIPFPIFEQNSKEPSLIAAMKKLNVNRKAGAPVEPSFFDEMFGDPLLNHPVWDFSNALEAIVWCNGPWCGQSPRAIRALLKLGYPANKIHYYRGGMQMWQILGLITTK